MLSSHLMQLNKRMWALFFGLWLVLTTTSSVIAEEKKAIIYEYDIITQKKGQSLASALDGTSLSSEEKAQIIQVPVMRKALGDRQFRVVYAVEKGARVIREVKVTRDNRKANFILVPKGDAFQFVSQPSKIPESALQKTPTLTSLDSEVKLLSTEGALFSMSVPQSQGQRLETVLTPLNLTKTQMAIIKTGDFRRSALSKRQLMLYFVGAPNSKLLRGLTVSRGNNRVDYTVEKQGGNYRLRSLTTLSEKRREEVLLQFTQAIPVLVKIQKPDGQTQSSKKQTSRADGKLDKNGYMLLRLTQEKGQSLSKVLKGQPLSKLQRQLVGDIPVTTKAKSRRYFYLLFEKSGPHKYLKAVRVVRGRNVAEFVLSKHQGKWLWADNKGRISTSGGFLRYPLSFKRISSGFNLRRRHPITRRIRPHKGTDFSAPHGTLIWAPADGVVSFSGRQRGYGIVLEIQHANGYKTKYAHLSRVLVRKGQKVKKRQNIARVGNTGASTGSHLHYEVHVNGRVRNPMTVRLPKGGGKKTLPVAKKEADRYLSLIDSMM